MCLHCSVKILIQSNWRNINPADGSESPNHIKDTISAISLPTCVLAMLLWRHNERDGVSNHRRLCLLNRLLNLFWWTNSRVAGVSDAMTPMWRHCNAQTFGPESTVPADGLASNGARPSTGMVMVSKSNILPPQFQLLISSTFSLSRVIILTHWGRDKMAAISQTTLSNVFSWMKMFEFRLKFHWSLFPRVQFTIFQHSIGSNDGLAPFRRQAIIWTNDG